MILHYRGCLIVFNNNTNSWDVINTEIRNKMPDWAKPEVMCNFNSLKTVTKFIDRWV